jgi:cytochrome bd-type quinol oxidase subunit 2
MAGTRYTGGELGWLSPFALLCAVGLCIGYALLGACWLVRKCEGDVREAAYRLIPLLSVALLAFLVVVFVYALAEDLQVLHRWLERPYLFIFPAIGAAAAVVLAASVRYRQDEPPFYMVAILFAAAFGTKAISFWPYMIPFSITIEQAAAPPSSLAFMFWGEGLFVFPLLLVYTAISYGVFSEEKSKRQKITTKILVHSRSNRARESSLGMKLSGRGCAFHGRGWAQGHSPYLRTRQAKKAGLSWDSRRRAAGWHRTPRG